MKKHVTIAGSLFLLAMTLWASGMAQHQHRLDSDEADHVVFKHLPQDDEHFRDDVAPLTTPLIERHGEEEWEIVVLTSEFHRHLGIYSILGAKMGLRARDHFKAELDELEVVSFAGLQPPISCLNDGLQVSTGATLGHGTITVASGHAPCPKAQFTHEDQSITLTLKSVYWNQIKKDIKTTIETHGIKTPAYWQAVRELGLQYWLKWSRDELFELTITTP